MFNTNQDTYYSKNNVLKNLIRQSSHNEKLSYFSDGCFKITSKKLSQYFQISFQQNNQVIKASFNQET